MKTFRTFALSAISFMAIFFGLSTATAQSGNQLLDALVTEINSQPSGGMQSDGVVSMVAKAEGSVLNMHVTLNETSFFRTVPLLLPFNTYWNEMPDASKISRETGWTAPQTLFNMHKQQPPKANRFGRLFNSPRLLFRYFVVFPVANKVEIIDNKCITAQITGGSPCRS